MDRAVATQEGSGTGSPSSGAGQDPWRAGACRERSSISGTVTVTLPLGVHTFQRPHRRRRAARGERLARPKPSSRKSALACPASRGDARSPSRRRAIAPEARRTAAGRAFPRSARRRPTTICANLSAALLAEDTRAGGGGIEQSPTGQEALRSGRRRRPRISSWRRDDAEPFDGRALPPGR